MVSEITKLDRQITSFNKRQERVERKLDELEETAENEEREFLKRENELLEEKLKISKEIFTWAKGFIKTKQYKELLELEGDEIQIHGGGWGHLILDKDTGGWSRFYLTGREKPKFRYWPGYKWYPYEGFTIATGEGLAKNLSHGYLDGILKSIKSEAVYREIRTNLTPIDDDILNK